MNVYDPDNQLNADEEARFASLPREVHVDSLAEERTIAALRNRGLLPHSRARFPLGLQLLTSLAAGLLLFAAGVTYGSRLAREEEPALSPVAEVQRAGSAYVAALVRLSESASHDSAHNLAAGLEAGTSTLRAAAFNAARMAPGDSTLGRLRDGLELVANIASIHARRDRDFIWY